MIKDKHLPIPTQVKSKASIPEEVAENPFVNMYQAVKRAILTLREDPDNPQSESFSGRLPLITDNSPG